MRTTLLFSSLAQKRAGVGVGFRSVLMSAMTDLNLCNQKLSPSQTTGKTVSEWQNGIKLLNQQILHARDVDRPPAPRPAPLGPGFYREVQYTSTREDSINVLGQQ